MSVSEVRVQCKGATVLTALQSSLDHSIFFYKWVPAHSSRLASTEIWTSVTTLIAENGCSTSYVLTAIACPMEKLTLT